MKNKLIMIAALFAVMVSMTGIAAADQINVFEPGTTTTVGTIQLLAGGAAVTKDLNVSEFLQTAGTAHTLTTAVSDPPGPALPSDIIVQYQELTTAPGPLAPGPYGWTQDAGVGGFEVLDVQFQAAAVAPPGTTYQIQITDLATGNTFTSQVVVAATTIPEFPAVALPVAAVIGLVYFFQHRKSKKE